MKTETDNGQAGTDPVITSYNVLDLDPPKGKHNKELELVLSNGETVRPLQFTSGDYEPKDENLIGKTMKEAFEIYISSRADKLVESILQMAGNAPMDDDQPEVGPDEVIKSIDIEPCPDDEDYSHLMINFENGQREFAFHFKNDELSFTNEEFVGKTKAQAIEHLETTRRSDFEAAGYVLEK